MKKPRLKLPILALAALLWPLCAGAQDGDTGSRPEPRMPDLGAPPEPSSPRNMPDTMAPPPSSGEDEMTPGALSPRAQFEAAMITVDSGFAKLMPAIPIAVADMKRLAFARLASDPKGAAQQRHLLQLRLRELAVAQQRLQSIDRVLERWRSTSNTTAGSTTTTMITGVRRRASLAAGLHRQIECGRYFAQATARAMRAGNTAARPPIPPGC